jgi:hypothetical protein
METISSFKKLFTIDYWQSKTKLQCETKMPTTTTKMHHEYNKVIRSLCMVIISYIYKYKTLLALANLSSQAIPC